MSPRQIIPDLFEPRDQQPLVADQEWSDDDLELSQPSDNLSDVSSNYSFEMDFISVRSDSPVSVSFTETSGYLVRRTIDECSDLLGQIQGLSQVPPDHPNLFVQLKSKLDYLLFLNERLVYRQRIARDFVDLGEYNEE